MSKSYISFADRFRGMVIGGAIGDAWGSAYEYLEKEDNAEVFYPFDKMEQPKPQWQITDDTQLTLATCEALTQKANTSLVEKVAQTFLSYYKAKRLTGLGASSLKALRELDSGGHWSQTGRRGDSAAGNGAAMRIAPLAFCGDIPNKEIYDICAITHYNDEAYTGALAVVEAIRCVLNNSWDNETNLLTLIIPKLPDTNVRDRLILLSSEYQSSTIEEVGLLGNSGYVVDTVSLALFAANQIHKKSMDTILQSIIDIGGDTDTNCSIAGQIIGAYLGIQNIPNHLIEQLKMTGSYEWIITVVEKTIELLNHLK